MTPSRPLLRICALTWALLLGAPVLHAQPLAATGARNAAFLRTGLEPTPFAGLGYARFGPGLVLPGAVTEAAADSAVFTALQVVRVQLQRTEPVFAWGATGLSAELAPRLAFGRDSAARYTSLGARLGLRVTHTLDCWELSGAVSYLPTFYTHLTFSSEQRDTYGDRYPDAEQPSGRAATPGPATANVLLGAQRVQGLLSATRYGEAWLLRIAAGTNASVGAGAQWTNLSWGQLPLLLSLDLAWRF
jgi:hypothetical protein